LLDTSTDVTEGVVFVDTSTDVRVREFGNSGNGKSVKLDKSKVGK
jgi:hypothetical protein